MTIRQQIMKLVYPLWTGFTRLIGKNNHMLINKKNTKPATSFYELSFVQNNGTTIRMDQYRGKKVLLVNTASDCGYTPQYEDLQKLYQENQEHLVVIGFPANDFKEQEKGSDEQIAQFCQVNFGVSFPLAKKSHVVRASDQNPVFRWLSDPSLNGWNDQEPVWNFTKYLVNEEGMLMGYYEPSLSPVSREIQDAIKNA